MSQAEALLNSLSEDQVNLYSSSDTTTSTTDYFVIGEDRVINIPSGQQKLGVQYDDDVNTVFFKCKRYWDGRDISTMKIYINYELPNGEPDGAIAENIKTFNNDPDNVYFEWRITSNVTPVKGNIKFLVCARRTDENGKQINHWNSELCTECYISEGLEVSGITTKQYNDITTKLLSMLSSVETNLTGYRNQQVTAFRTEAEAITNNLLASIPEDYLALEESVDDANRNRAVAITNEVEGDILALTDSSHSPLRNLRVFGKTASTNTTGANILSKASVATFLNNAGSQKTGIAIPIETTGKYTYYVSDTVTAYIGYTTSLQSNATHFTSAMNGCPVKGAVNLERTNYFLIWFDSNVTFTDAGKYFLGLGENLIYEPYTGKIPGPTPDYPITIDNLGVGPGSIKVDIYNKNLFVSTVTTYSVNGITIDQNEDGSFHVYGTTTSLAIPRVSNITLKAGKTYVLSGGTELAQVTVRDSGASMNFATSHGDSKSFSVSEDISVSIYIRVESGITLDTVVYPMLQLADFQDTTFDSSAGRQTLTLPLEYGLPGMDELGVYDEIDLERGVHIHRIGRASLLDYIGSGAYSDNLAYSDTIVRFDFGACFGTKKTDPIHCNRFINKFVHGENAAEYRNTECISTHSVNDLVSVFVRKDRIGGSSITNLINWLENNETIIQYRLATPYETELTTDEIAAYKALMTNFPYTTVCNNVSANMLIRYNVDTKTYIIQNGSGGGSTPGNTYSKSEIDQMFGSYVTDIASLIGGIE